MGDEHASMLLPQENEVDFDDLWHGRTMVFDESDQTERSSSREAIRANKKEKIALPGTGKTAVQGVQEWKVRYNLLRMI